jgi:hypothetical protein
MSLTDTKQTAAKPNFDQANLERLILFILLGLIFLAAARSPLDTDMWWHLRAGEVSWQTGKPLLTDLFSATRYAQPWTNHSWLAEVLMYGLFQLGGYLALGAMVAMLATLSMALVYFQMEGPALFKAFLMILATLVAAVVWSPRPQLLSMLLVALSSYILFLYKWRRVDRLWLLPLIFVLWSNLHGGYPLGLLLIGFMIAGEITNHFLGNGTDEMLGWRKIIQLALIGIICGFAVLLNPNGIETWLIPFRTVGVNVLQRFVSEWASPDFHELSQQPLLWLLFATAIAIGISGRKLDGTDLVNFAGFGYMALVARRNFGPFSLVAAPILARYLWAAVQNWQANAASAKYLAGLFNTSTYGTNSNSQNGLKKAINLAIVGVIWFAAFCKLIAVTNPIWIESNLVSGYPVKAVEWIQSRHLQGNIFNEYNWGGFLIWFNRENPVFVDGRTDLFGDEILNQWIDGVQGSGNWQAAFDRYQIRLAILEPGRPLVAKLESLGWKSAYHDDQAVVLTR